MAQQLRQLSINEYMQLCTMNELIYSIMSMKTLWFAQVAPKELGDFHWQIDAKGPVITRSEALWEKLVMPMQESRTWREPIMHMVEADYSYFERFSMTFSEDQIAERSRVYGVARGEIVPGINIRLVLNEDRAFVDSRESLGLQLADVLTNLICRAMKGNIGRRAWWHLDQLMHLAPRDREVVYMTGIHTETRRWKSNPPYYYFLAQLRRKCRRPFVE